MTAEFFWALGRGTGVAALVLLTLALMLGATASTGQRILHIERFVWQSVHRDAALTASGLVAVHVVSLVLDPYAALRWADIMLPFQAGSNPVWVGFGTVALDLLFAVALTGLTRRLIGPRIFAVIHLGTYVLWPVALIHSIGSGSDFTSTKSVLAALAAGAATCLLTVYLLARRQRNRQRIAGFRPVSRATVFIRKK